MVDPLFVISLPRAGSTLLQRLLMAHSAIDSCGEPWLALPLAYMLKKDGVISDYGHKSAQRSIQSFVNGLPHGEDDFYQEASTFLTRLYESRSKKGSRFFLDKTPRYYKIMPQLRKMFPEAPVILLLRNPLSVFGSMLNFIDGDLRYLPMWKNDWLGGSRKMSALLREDAHSHVVRFEEMVSSSEKVMSGVMAFLGLHLEDQQIQSFADQKLDRGDPTGVKVYDQIDAAPLSSWKRSIDTYTKKRIAMQWLKMLPDDVWGQQGYDRSSTLEELEVHEPESGFRLSDTFWESVGRLYFNYRFHLRGRFNTYSDLDDRPFYN
jgi:hypothetical protein